MRTHFMHALDAFAVAVALATLVLGGAVTACAAASPAAAPSPASPARQVADDEAYVAKAADDCAAFTPSPHRCTFAVAGTSNRSGGRLYGVELIQQTGDDCYRGIVYFFAGTRFITSTRLLPPHSIGGVRKILADGASRFSVVYWVNENEYTSCAGGGDGGTDTYVYRWTGARLVRESGHLPRPPRVILGTGLPDRVPLS
jgi:hypothetical protein